VAKYWTGKSIEIVSVAKNSLPYFLNAVIVNTVLVIADNFDWIISRRSFL